MKIQVLPSHVANQIAAGEVIERPASVIKELLENALDAGARTIQIDIGFGGLNQMTVSDDGFGIAEDDLPLAVAPHATSKLRTLDDLSSMATMGFRGEALASIASVSRLSIQSRPKNQPHAVGLSVDEGGGVHLMPAARSPGTTVDIRDLFFNAPVRKKFLKTEALEYAAIESVVKRFAFSEPEVALRLTHNGKERITLSAAVCAHTKRLRLQKLLGKAFVDQALEVNAARGNMCVQGWVSGTGYARSQQDKQWIYINRRMVKDKLMLHAIKLAYEHILSPGRYPACLLYLTLAADEVDVNVHPTKHEVRFNDPRSVHDLIRSSIIDVVAHEPISATAGPLFLPPMTIQRPFIPERACTCVVLDTRFAILFEHSAPYLVDMIRVRQQRLLSQLESQPQPWATRPLLVPVSIPVPKEHMDVMLAYQPALVNYGLVIEPCGDSAMRVRSIPRDLPALDLHGMMQSLVSESPALGGLSAWLLRADVWDLLSMTDDEKADLMAYWVVTRSHAVRLDHNKCMELISHV